MKVNQVTRVCKCGSMPGGGWVGWVGGWMGGWVGVGGWVGGAQPDPAEAGSEQKVTGFSSFDALLPAADSIYANFSRGGDLNFIHTNFRGLTAEKS